MKRRELIKGLSVLPLAGAVSGSAFAAIPSIPQKGRKSIYEAIGVRPLINARGTVTVVGASQIMPEVQQAMDDAVREYVQMPLASAWVN
jgi:L-seryl-tRNA(Ser) seleniumtransferase